MTTGLALMALLAGLWGTGVLRPETFGFGDKGDKKAPSRVGLVAIPMSGEMIPAYAQLTRDHFWDAKLGDFAVVYMPPSVVTPGMIRDMGTIVGRVMSRDKPAGYVFTEADFLPQGTRPGLVGGIPPGKRAIRFDSEKVSGLQGLRRGDRFDLIATLPLDTQGADPSVGLGGGIYAQQMELQARMSNWRKQATVTVVVLNGVVVEPIGVRNVPTTSSTLIGGSVTKGKPVQEVVIAIAPSEVAPLTEALAVDAHITCVPRSGRPDDDPSVAPAPSRPRSPYSGSASGLGAGPMTTMETINGTKQEIISTPRQK
ncbi:MAG: hypothetical protein NTV52_24540 [Acidobacteria bacterium]|nr:hypothetical protein [Acidobacteriota bacterium]